VIDHVVTTMLSITEGSSDKFFLIYISDLLCSITLCLNSTSWLINRTISYASNKTEHKPNWIICWIQSSIIAIIVIANLCLLILLYVYSVQVCCLALKQQLSTLLFVTTGVGSTPPCVELWCSDFLQYGFRIKVCAIQQQMYNPTYYCLISCFIFSYKLSNSLVLYINL